MSNRDFDNTGESQGTSTFIYINGKEGGIYLKTAEGNRPLKGFSGYIDNVNLYQDEGSEEHRIEASPVMRVVLSAKHPDTGNVEKFTVDIPLRYPIAAPRIINNLATIQKGDDLVWAFNFFKKDGKDSIYSFSSLNDNKEGYIPWDEENLGFKGAPKKIEDPAAYYEFWVDIIKENILTLFGGSEIDSPKPSENPKFVKLKGFTITTINALKNPSHWEMRLKDAKAAYEKDLDLDERASLYMLWQDWVQKQKGCEDWTVADGLVVKPTEATVTEEEDDLPF